MLLHNSCKATSWFWMISWTILSLVVANLAGTESRRYIISLKWCCTTMIYIIAIFECYLLCGLYLSYRRVNPSIACTARHNMKVIWCVQVGLIAVNDGIVLRTHISRILKTHFRQSPIYTQLLEIFNEVSCLFLNTYTWFPFYTLEAWYGTLHIAVKPYLLSRKCSCKLACDACLYLLSLIHETSVESTNLAWSFFSWVSEELEVLDFV